MNLYIGLMSGTSIDGIDAALVDVESQQLIHGITFDYRHTVKKKLQQIQTHHKHSFETIHQLDRMIGQDFAAAVQALLLQSKVSAREITAIGSHGQTLCHDSYAETPYTQQSGCAHTIAEITNIPVVADFRTRDMVAGGQGAPLAPLYHQALFAGSSDNIAVINIGGIANISLIMTDNTLAGWDVGPGNCLMDEWISKHLGQSYDENGHWASKGRIIPELLNAVLADPFFSKAPPKSIGKEYFSLNWLRQYLHQDYKATDVQATLLELTADCIAKTVKQSKANPSILYLCGGGTHNQALRQAISNKLSDVKVESTAEKNISPDYLEAMMFAWLAKKAMKQEALDLSQVTGSKHSVILGAFYPVVRR